MSHFLSIVECAIEHEGRYLIIKRPDGVHAGGLLAFPGGKVDYEDGDDNQDVLLRAALREVKEEVGLDLIDPVHYAASSYFNDSHGEHVLDIIFYCRLDQTTIDVIPSEKEVPEYFWLTADEINAHPLAPEWLKRYLSIIEKKFNLLEI